MLEAHCRVSPVIMHQPTMELLLRSLHENDASHQLQTLYKQFEFDWALFERFISPSADAASPFHLVLATDPLRLLCIELYANVLAILLRQKNYILLHKAMKQLTGLYQLKDFSQLANLMQQLYRDAVDETKLAILEYLPKVVLDSNQRQLIACIRESVLATASDALWLKVFETLLLFNIEYLLFDDFLFVFDLLSPSFSLGTKELAFFKFMLHASQSVVQFEIVWMKLKLYTKDKLPPIEIMQLVLTKLLNSPSLITSNMSREPHILDTTAAICSIGLNKITNMRHLPIDLPLQHLEFLLKILNQRIAMLSHNFLHNLLSYGQKHAISVIYETLFCIDSEKLKIDIIDILLGMISNKDQKQAQFAFSVLMGLSTVGLRSHVSYLKLSIDTIQDLPAKSVTSLLNLLISLFYPDLRRDSFVSEFLIVLKKQVNSKHIKFCKIGLEGLFLIVERFALKQSDSGEKETFISTPCASQAVLCGLSENQAFCFDLIKFVLRSAKASPMIMEIALPYFMRLSPQLPTEIYQYLEDELIEYLKNLFFIDLQEEKVADRLEIFDLSEKSSPIAIVIQDDYGAILPFFVQLLVQHSVKTHGDVNEIDALLYCSIFVDQNNCKIKQYLHAYLTSLINSFGQYSEFKSVLFGRFKQLAILEDIQLGDERQVKIDQIKFAEKFTMLQTWIALGKETKNTSKSQHSNATPCKIDSVKIELLENFLDIDELTKNMKLTFYFLDCLFEHSNLHLEKYFEYFKRLFLVINISDKFSLQVAKKSIALLLNAIKFQADSTTNTIENVCLEKENNNNKQFSQNLVANTDSFSNSKYFDNKQMDIDESVDVAGNLTLSIEHVQAQLVEAGIIDKIAKDTSLSKELIDIMVVIKIDPLKIIRELHRILASPPSACLGKKDFTYFALQLLQFTSGTDALELSFDSLLQQLQNNTNVSEEILHGIFAFLSDSNRASEKCILREKIRCFYLLMNSIRSLSGQTALLISITKSSKKFLEYVVKWMLPLIGNSFVEDAAAYVEILKTLQLGTRVLHSVCLFLKENCKQNVSHIASLKKTLELLVIEVKNLLTANGCISAFWMGNLKQKNLDGEVLLSQVPTT